MVRAIRTDWRPFPQSKQTASPARIKISHRRASNVPLLRGPLPICTNRMMEELSEKAGTTLCKNGSAVQKCIRPRICVSECICMKRMINGIPGQTDALLQRQGPFYTGRTDRTALCRGPPLFRRAPEQKTPLFRRAPAPSQAPVQTKRTGSSSARKCTLYVGTDGLSVSIEAAAGAHLEQLRPSAQIEQPLLRWGSSVPVNRTDRTPLCTGVPIDPCQRRADGRSLCSYRTICPNMFS